MKEDGKMDQFEKYRQMFFDNPLMDPVTQKVVKRGFGPYNALVALYGDPKRKEWMWQYDDQGFKEFENFEFIEGEYQKYLCGYEYTGFHFNLMTDNLNREIRRVRK